ncbi:MAG: hypothetical protein KQI81_08780 [Deltaproteobacteria bacterium]|nr:hypothetical protein [Deltaproteobacteria bacterium]
MKFISNDLIIRKSGICLEIKNVDQPYITGVNGYCSVDDLQEINDQLAAHPEDVRFDPEEPSAEFIAYREPDQEDLNPIPHAFSTYFPGMWRFGRVGYMAKQYQAFPISENAGKA